MRTIKFRVWDKELKKYRSKKDGDYSLGVLSGKVRGIYGERFPQMEVQQFTGLTDINGKEIYEGDIVRWGMHGGSWGHETWNRYAEVEINPDLQFRIIHYIHSETGEKRPTDNYIFHFGKFAYTETEQFLEIIGNVFENPELLKTVSSKNKA